MRVVGTGPPEVYSRAPREGHNGLSPAQEPRGVWEDVEHQSQSQGWVGQAGGRKGTRWGGRDRRQASPPTPRPLTATTNRAGLPRALSTVTFSQKQTKKILIWSFFCFQSGQGAGEGMRWERGPSPSTMCRSDLPVPPS